MAFIVGGLVLLLAGAFVGLKWYGHSQELKRMALTSVVSHYSKDNMKRLVSEGKRTIARLHLSQNSGTKEQTITYALLALDSLMEQGDFKVPNTQPILLPSGFPFAEGDEFEAIYLPSDPAVHRVDFFQPSRNTTSRYISLATTAEKAMHPATNPERSVCRVLTAAEYSGWPVLAHFIFQDKTPDENKRFNQASYHKFWENPDLQKAVVRNCSN